MTVAADPRPVKVVVALPADHAADVEQVRAKDTDFLGRAIQYALARQIIFEELVMKESNTP